MTTINRSARVGVLTDQTGALSFMGLAAVNVAKLVIDDLNDRGGLLGHPDEVFVEDSATDESVAESRQGSSSGPSTSSRAASTARRSGPSGDPTSTKPERCTSTRRTTKVRTVTPHLLHGAGPVQQVEPFLRRLMQRTGGEALLHALSRLHLAASDEPLTGRARSSIQAVQVERFGVENLNVQELADPVPGPGEVLIATEAATINPADLAIVTGTAASRFPPEAVAPYIPVWDLVGQVVGSGGGVDNTIMGARVVGFTNWFTTGRGTQASVVALPATNVVVAPDRLPSTELTTVGVTAGPPGAASQTSASGPAILS
jgi:Periplasmic binding protein/Alcohol dehydrogenase GroES-like domain